MAMAEASSLQRGLRVLVIGGSIAGLSCAISLLQAGCQLFVFEKARSLSAAGAGLGLDAPTCSALHRWGLSQALLQHTLPLSIEEADLFSFLAALQSDSSQPPSCSLPDALFCLIVNLLTFLQNRVVDSVRGRAQVIARDHDYGHRASHWSDLHRILYDALPAGTVHWGHRVISFEETNDGNQVRVEVRVADSSCLECFEGDLLVAADGSMSETRKRFVPNETRRYCGYCAWRGLLDSSSEEGLKIKTKLNEQYPNLGSCLYFDIAEKTHAVLYELSGGRLNWLWYVNQPEPNLKGSSLTATVDEETIARMRKEAREVWMPELADLMCATPAPFINAIFDREPLQQLVWGRVVLVGEAAHPTSPHGLRSTNMSIMDAAVLGECIAKWSSDVNQVLKEYQSIRLPVTSQQVLVSRHLGQTKQGFSCIAGFSRGEWDMLLQRNMHMFQQK